LSLLNALPRTKSSEERGGNGYHRIGSLQVHPGVWADAGLPSRRTEEGDFKQSGMPPLTTGRIGTIQLVMGEAAQLIYP